MPKLTPNTEKLADVLYKSYNLSNGDSSFSCFSHLGMNEAQLLACFDELEKYGLAFVDYEEDGFPFLTILPNLLICKSTGKLQEIING